MAIAWFLCPYKRDLRVKDPTRYCAMDDLTPEIHAIGGDWSEAEIDGNQAIVHESFDVGRMNASIDDGATIVSVVAAMLARML